MKRNIYDNVLIFADFEATGLWGYEDPNNIQSRHYCIGLHNYSVSESLKVRFKAWQSNYNKRDPWEESNKVGFSGKRFDWAEHNRIGYQLAVDFKFEVGPDVLVTFLPEGVGDMWALAVKID